MSGTVAARNVKFEKQIQHQGC